MSVTDRAELKAALREQLADTDFVSELLTDRRAATLVDDFDAFSGEVSVIVRRLAPSSATVLEHNADAILQTASSAKIALLVAVARAIESGELGADEQLRRDSAPFVRDSGIWWQLDQPTLSVADAAKLVGTLSDNLATNVLLQRLGGPRAIAAAAHEYGIEGFTLHDFVRDERLPEHAPALSTGSARAYAKAFALLSMRAGEDDSVATRVLEWMRDNADLSMVASAFGLDPLAHTEADRGITLINKTGTSEGVRADSGLVMRGETTIAYSCLINWDIEDPATDPSRDQALGLMAAVGHVIRARLS